jgi:hypothetical protein
MADNAYLRRLKEFDSVVPLGLEARAAGIYERPLLIEGNSILSTVFVDSIDVGATVAVSYYDYTTGEQLGEAYQLEAHRILSAAGDIDRISVTKIHNKPIVRCEVLGGTAKFSVYITVVSSFTSDLDNALKYDEEIVNYLRDKGMPIMGLDVDDSQFNFIQARNGRLLVEIVADSREINKRLYMQNLGVTPGTENLALDYTVPIGKRFIWISGFGASDCQAKWRCQIDGTAVLTRRSNYDEREVKLYLDYPFIMNEGQNLKVYAKNTTIVSSNSEIETWIYGFEETL